MSSDDIDFQGASHGTNPYDEGDPISVPSRPARRTQGDHVRRDGTRTRSRTVQSARDAVPARSQQHIERMGDSDARIRPSHMPSQHAGRSHERTRTSVRQPQPVRQPTQRGRGQAGPRTSRPGYTPIATTSDRRRQPQRQPSVRKRRKAGFGIIAGAIIVAIAGLAFLLWWLNRPVPVTVNGEACEVRVGSSLEDVLHEQRISVTPGDYVSVSDAVLEAGKGRQFSAEVNGEKLSDDQTDAYRVEGGESIEFSDGSNTIEDYKATQEQILPYLRMEGSGYSVQYISQWGYAGIKETRKGKVSGETAEVVTKQPQDCVITCMDPYLSEGPKLVALTFDDGPLSPYTADYLDILAQYGAKATFFNLGVNVQANPELARRIVEEGHELANHTMDHNQLTAVDADTIHEQITYAAGVIEDETGVSTTHLRPPYGDFTERSWLGSGGAITASIRWTADSLDWTLPGSDAIVANSLGNVYSGMIILMHDGGGDRSQDVAALPQILQELQSQGYEFVTVADLMRAIGGIPEEVCSGTGTMPKDAVWPEEIAPEDIAAAEAASAA